MDEFLDQAPNIDALSACLREQLGGDWVVNTFWEFESIKVDIIATHPAKGLAIFRVVTLPNEYIFSDRNKWTVKNDDEIEGPSSSVLPDEDGESQTMADPREQIEYWREQVQSLLESSAPNSYKRYLTFALVVFQNGSNAQKNLERLKKRTHYAHNVKIRSELIESSEAFREISNRLIPESGSTGAKGLPEKMWIKIQTLILGDPSLIIEQLPPPMNDFDAEQIRFIQRVGKSTYSRLSGPAGSGKTTVVARLAADAVLRGERVLVVSRNKSICPLIQARVRRYVIDIAKDKQEQHDLIRKADKYSTIMHQEAWWKSVFAESGYLDASNWHYHWDIEHARESKSKDDERQVEVNQLVLLKKALDRLTRWKNEAFRYDLVVIDEAQNILVENWEAMKMTLRSEESRAVVVADPSQSLYGDRPWTDVRMPGFVGPWSKLSGSHRIPSNCVSLIRDFAEFFPPGDDVSLPQMPMQDDLFFPDANLWHVVPENIEKGWQAELITRCVIYMRDIEMFEPYEIAFLVANNERGKMVNKRLRKIDESLETTTSFNKATRAEFGLGMGVRGSTVHSFAGWESPCLIVDLEAPDHLESPNQVIYSAITRIRKRMGGSALVFVCGDDRYSDFFRQRTQKLSV